MTKAVSIIGIGSPHGADRMGWLATEQLQSLAWPFTTHWHSCRTPAELPGLLANTTKAVLIDALAAPTSTGNILRLTADQIQQQPQICSSHGFDLAAALNLTTSLGDCPPHLLILGIPVDPTQDLPDPPPDGIIANLRQQLLDWHQSI